MKRMKDRLVGALIMLVIIATGATAFAAVRITSINVTYRDIKVAVNGTLFALKDVSGNTVEPFIYNGTTYLPLRAVGEAVGYAVNWDNETSTVNLTDAADGNTGNENATGEIADDDALNLIDTYAPYDSTPGKVTWHKSDGTTYLNMGGNKYKNSLLIESSQSNINRVSFILDGRHTSLTGIVGEIDGSRGALIDTTLTVSIYGDDNLIKTIDIAKDSLPTSFSVDVTGVNLLKFEVSPNLKSDYESPDIGFAELKIK